MHQSDIAAIPQPAGPRTSIAEIIPPPRRSPSPKEWATFERADDALDLVIPVYNEMECLDELVRRLSALRDSHPHLAISAVLVDDGSSDGSGDRLRELSSSHSWITTVHLVRNFGHQAAVTAGLDASSAQYVAVIDADLQDPPELVPEMLAKLRAEDLHVVYGVREQRPGDSRFKLRTAAAFYRILRWTSGLDIPLDTGDFRVMDRMVVDSLRRLPEHNRLMRALIPWLGYRSAGLRYNREERFAGATKYPLRKMIVLAAHAIFSFSTYPIRLVQMLGFGCTALGSFLLAVCATLALTTSRGVGVGIWLGSGMIVQTGLLLSAIGIIGGYVFRIQDEVKGRPVYVREGTKVGDRRTPGDRRKRMNDVNH